MKRIDGHIVTAYAESVSGPGWANQPVWVVYRGRDGQLREECLQPDEQPAEMVWLYTVSQAAHGAMVKLARKVIREDR